MRTDFTVSVTGNIVNVFKLLKCFTSKSFAFASLSYAFGFDRSVNISLILSFLKLNVIIPSLSFSGQLFIIPGITNSSNSPLL